MAYVRRRHFDHEHFLDIHHNSTRQRCVEGDNALADHIDHVRAQADRHDVQFANQEAFNRGVQNIIHPLEGRAARADASIAALRAENDILRAQVGQLQARNMELRGDADTLRTALETTSARFEQALDGVHASIRGVSTGLTTLRADHDRFASRVQRYLVAAAELGISWGERVQGHLRNTARQLAQAIRELRPRLMGGMLAERWTLHDLQDRGAAGRAALADLEQRPPQVREAVEEAVNGVRTQDDWSQLPGRVALALAAS